MEALIIDPGALRRAYRDINLMFLDTVVYQKNVDGNTVIGLYSIYLEGLEIRKEVIIL